MTEPKIRPQQSQTPNAQAPDAAPTVPAAEEDAQCKPRVQPESSDPPAQQRTDVDAPEPAAGMPKDDKGFNFEPPRP